MRITNVCLFTLLASGLSVFAQQIAAPLSPVQPIAPRYDFTVQQPRSEGASRQPFCGAQPSRIFRPEQRKGCMRRVELNYPLLYERRNDTWEEKIFMMVSEVYMADPSNPIVRP